MARDTGRSISKQETTSDVGKGCNGQDLRSQSSNQISCLTLNKRLESAQFFIRADFWVIRYVHTSTRVSNSINRRPETEEGKGWGAILDQYLNIDELLRV